MQAKVISIENPRAPHIHSKFIKRRAHVEQTLVPSLRAIGLDASIFPAVTHADVQISDGLVICGDIQVKQGSYGCVGNFVSNMQLWQQCVKLGEPILILEDDALLPAENAEIVKSALAEFSKRPEAAVLYLLSECVWQQRLKTFDLHVADGQLRRLVQTNDLAGTAAYAITPSAAARLLYLATIRTTSPTDHFLHTAFNEGAINMLIPHEFDRCFMLHETWESWNHKHDPNA